MLRQECEAVTGDRRIHRCAERLPVGTQFGQRARIHDGTGQDVGADFRAFLDQANIDFRVDLLQANRGGKPGRATTHDHDVEFHGFALHAYLDGLD